MKNRNATIPGGRTLLKAILQALLILAVTAGLSQAILFPLIQNSLLAPLQRWEAEYLGSGTIDLVAAELNKLDAGARQRRLAELSEDFGFELILGDISSVELDPESLQRLNKHEAVGDPSTYSIFKLLDNGTQVLVFSRIKNPSRSLPTEAQRRSMGTLAMLERSLQDQAEASWPAAIEASAESYDYPVQLLPLGDTGLATAQRNKLSAGAIVTIATEDSEAADYPAEFVFKKVGSSVIVLGPFSPPTLRRFYPVITGYYILLALIVLLPLVLWLAPTWRSMNQLSRATTAFGHGNFAVRAVPIRGSQTNYLIAVFNQMAGKIQGLVESNKALINAVSHELRTPISRIEFNIELARQSSDIAERNRQLERIEDAVDNLKTMVSEMLQYARFDREKPNFKMETVNLGDWLRSELDTWQDDGEHAAIDIGIDVPDNKLQAALERYYMSRAVSNLVRNAMRFATSTVRVGATLENGVCEVSVADDGPGVDRQERTRIFEPFVRHDDSRNRETGGTGLGLAIVKQIVAWHSGDVWVEDADLGGARFVIQWPCEQDA